MISNRANSRRCIPATTRPRSIKIPIASFRSTPCARSRRRKGFKKLHDHYFVTTGTGAMPSKMAELGAGIADELVSAGVNAVILTAT